MVDSALKKQIDERAAVINPMKEELIKRLNLPYKPEDLHEDISLFGAGLGLDSLDALEVVLCVEHCFGIKIPDNNVSILRSINTLADYVIEQKKAMKVENEKTCAS
ncbi:phosphopantetheine-binding protein [Candidatus Omnitrophota bacterium]